ncbi:MAG: hypothetical protein H8E55_24860 [Pelagibacterales bacterium]|nr:hypothetical protein [Pelagibacterales bacterium]
MKKFFFLLIFFLFSSSSLFAEYRLEPGNCTLKKKSNCGAYLYNSSTGATYFCDTEKCKEVMAPMEEDEGAVVKDGEKKSKKSKIPKKLKKSKIPKFKKKTE